jgi:hypothetical protein
MSSLGIPEHSGHSFRTPRPSILGFRPLILEYLATCFGNVVKVETLLTLGPSESEF